jgi:hypothetical protein
MRFANLPESGSVGTLKARTFPRSPKKLSLRVAGVVPVNSLWKQAFATALAPARKSGAAALCSHTCAKTMLAFTRSFRWLVSAFH